MKAGLARCLTALYPRRWRERYGREFAALLEDRPASLSTLSDVLFSALKARAMTISDLSMTSSQRSVVLFGWAGLATLAAAVNLYFSVDDTAVAAAMTLHPTLSVLFSAIAMGSAAALIVAALLGVPIFFRLLKASGADGRWQFLRPFAMALGLAAGTIVWLVVAGVSAHAAYGGNWVPLPWNVHGLIGVDGPPDWLRWGAGLVTLALLLGGLVSVAVGIRQALHRYGASLQWSPIERALGFILAAAMLVTAGAAATWGIVAQASNSSAFHGGSGFLATTIFVSWAASAIVFIAGAVIAGRGAAAVVGARAS